jgi:hypothetical protein
MQGKVRYTVLGGPDKGKQGVIKDIREQVCPADHQKRKLCYIEFDQPMTPLKQNQIGVMLELDRPDQGSIRESNNPAHWNTLGNTAHVGDVPPGSFGQAALWLNAGEKSSHYAFGLSFAKMLPMGDSNWKVTLWAKAKSGSPTLTVHLGDQREKVPLTKEWVRHEIDVTLPAQQANPNVGGRVVASGGDVLIDDITFQLDEPGSNPTAFRDLLIEPLKKLNPGILRYLQMGGSNLADNLRPRLRQIGSTRDFGNLTRGGRNHAQYYKFNLHDFYVLCEYVGADPWYCLPGTIHPEEINLLMEYLGGPANTPGGKIRAELGRPKPWTEVFGNIYVEIGNEAWNPSGYATGSYNGPSHWHDIFATAMASPHYAKNTLFVAGAQAGAPHVAQSVLTHAPNADLVAIAPYMIHHLEQSEIEPLDTDEKLFKWVFGFADWRVNAESGEVRRNYENAAAKDTELSIYEHNYHITKPSAKDGGAPIDLRNRIIASLGGGLNLINDSLHMLRDCGVRSQCLFNLNQSSFREDVKLWGFMPGLSLDAPRYRPNFLAMEVANKVLRGDLVETRHSEDEPTFTAHGIMEWRWRQEPEFSDYGPLPTIRSYAFKDGDTCGVILFNLDTRDAHRAKLHFPGAVKDGSAHAWQLTADSIAANNEYETGEPQVRIATSTIQDFANGKILDMPPHSMLAIEWEQEN